MYMSVVYYIDLNESFVYLGYHAQAKKSLQQIESLFLETASLATHKPFLAVEVPCRRLVCRQIVVSRPVVRPLGRSLITVSSSLSMPVLACALSLTISCLMRSSFIFAIRSSRVKVLL